MNIGFLLVNTDSGGRGWLEYISLQKFICISSLRKIFLTKKNIYWFAVLPDLFGDAKMIMSQTRHTN